MTIPLKRKIDPKIIFVTFFLDLEMKYRRFSINMKLAESILAMLAYTFKDLFL
jgi:hypothetical protein